MSWFDILKNQISAPGLSMRTMNLDNLIDDEEDDCMSKLLDTIENFINKDRVSVSETAINVLTQMIFKYNGSDEHICEVLRFLKSFTADKLIEGNGAVLVNKRNTLWEFVDIGEFTLNVGLHRDQPVFFDEDSKVHLNIYVEWGKSSDDIIISIGGDSVEEIAKIIQECVVV